MKLSIETGSIDYWMFLPVLTLMYAPSEKRIELGVYFLKYFLTINIKQ